MLRGDGRRQAATVYCLTTLIPGTPSERCPTTLATPERKSHSAAYGALLAANGHVTFTSLPLDSTLRRQPTLNWTSTAENWDVAWHAAQASSAIDENVPLAEQRGRIQYDRAKRFAFWEWWLSQVRDIIPTIEPTTSRTGVSLTGKRRRREPRGTPSRAIRRGAPEAGKVQSSAGDASATPGTHDDWRGAKCRCVNHGGDNVVGLGLSPAGGSPVEGARRGHFRRL